MPRYSYNNIIIIVTNVIKGATKLHFMYYQPVVIILF